MEKPRIIVKTKNLQLVFDYCIESKTEFTVIPKNSSDDWEIELNIRNIVDAVKWGMFLKANKIDLLENPLLINPVSISKPTTASLQRTKKDRQLKTNAETLNSIHNSIELRAEVDEKTENTKISQESILDFSEQNKQNELL